MVASLIISVSLQAFLVYAFISLLIALDVKIDYLRALIRVLLITSDAKLVSLLRKNKILDEEVLGLGQEMRDKMTLEQIEDLEKDIRKVIP